MFRTGPGTPRSFRASYYLASRAHIFKLPCIVYTFAMTTTATESGAEGVPTAEEWVDVRMTDPEEGEWTVDAVVIDGRAEFVDLRVRRDLLASFVACLLDDLDDAAAEGVLAEAAASVGVEPRTESE